MGPINDQVRVDRKKLYIFVSQILPTVAGTGGPSEKFYFFADGGFKQSAIARLVCSLM